MRNIQKKAAGGISGMNIVIILVLVVIAGSIAYVASKMSEPAGEVSITTGTAATETGTELITATVSCPSDDTTDGQVRYEELLSGTDTYGTPTCYFLPKTEGQERITAGTLTTDGTYSSGVDLPCTTSGTKWQIVCVGKQDNTSSVVESTSFTAAGPFVRRDVEGKRFKRLQIKVEDKFAGAATFFNISCDASGTTGYEAMDQVCNATDATGKSSLGVDADEYIDATIFVKTNSTKAQFGEEGLRTWMLVNADTDKWEEPSVGLVGGPTLVSQIESMYPTDIKKYSGYEYAYEIGPIGDRDVRIDFFIQTAIDVDPGAGNDPVINFCAESRYDSSKEGDKILVGCWSDATTQVQIATAVAQQLTLNVTA